VGKLGVGCWTERAGKGERRNAAKVSKAYNCGEGKYAKIIDFWGGEKRGITTNTNRRDQAEGADHFSGRAVVGVSKKNGDGK